MVDVGMFAEGGFSLPKESRQIERIIEVREGKGLNQVHVRDGAITGKIPLDLRHNAKQKCKKTVLNEKGGKAACLTHTLPSKGVFRRVSFRQSLRVLVRRHRVLPRLFYHAAADGATQPQSQSEYTSPFII